MSNWITIELKNACSRLSSGKGISSKKISPEGKFPVFGGNGIRGFTDKSNFKGECAIIGRQGAYCGNVRFFSGEAYMTEHAVVVCANNENNTRYLAYLLSIMQLGRLSGQSAQPGLSVKTLGIQKIKVPPLCEQEKIAGLLSKFDEKIRLNNEINKNLQEQAQAIFKSWFIDFEPFDSEMISTWAQGKLKDVLLLKKNAIKAGTNPELPYLPIDIIPMRSLAITDFRPNDEAKSSLITFDEDDILVGAMRVYFHRVALAPCSGITRTTCFILAPRTKSYLAYGLLCCNQDSSIAYAQKTSKGSTMPYAIWEGGLGDMKILVPPEKVAEEFNIIMMPILKKIKASYFENRHLRELRNSLLPKLMSGELDVSDLNI